jgi:TctA family transporter
MSELLSNLALGFGVAFSPMNVLFCLLGALVGTLVGVPGIELSHDRDAAPFHSACRRSAR